MNFYFYFKLSHVWVVFVVFIDAQVYESTHIHIAHLNRCSMIERIACFKNAKIPRRHSHICTANERQ